MKEFKTMPNTEFGRWLYNRMRVRNYSCGVVARMLRTTRQAIANHVSGRVKPSYVWVLAYCQIFNGDSNKVWEMVEKDAR